MSGKRKTIRERLLAACDGHPHARIPWPHRLLHDAENEIGKLEDALARALKFTGPRSPVRKAVAKILRGKNERL